MINAFNAGTNFIWLTPNDCNNMHSCSVATGDNYIHGWVPQLLTAMNGKNALLILTFDEAYTNPPYIYHAFIGPAAKLAYKSTVEYTHYSLAKMIEDVWGGGNLGQNDVSANSPVESQFRFSRLVVRPVALEAVPRKDRPHVAVEIDRPVGRPAGEPDEQQHHNGGAKFHRSGHRKKRREESAAEKWEYIRENPVRAGLVSHWSDWPYRIGFEL